MSLDEELRQLVERFQNHPDFIRREAEAEAAKARQHEEDMAAAAVRERAMLVDAGIPARHVDLLLDEKVAETDALMRTRSWLATDRAVLLLAGDVGTGKSFAAAWACTRMRGARFLSPSALMRLPQYDENVMGVIERAPLLVLDDLGAEFGDSKGFVVAKVDLLVTERHAQARKTILTSNLNLQQFAQRFGARVADRLRGDGVAVVLQGSSMRGRKGGADRGGVHTSNHE